MTTMTTSVATTTAAATVLAKPTAEEETPWIDAWIRWERNSKDCVIEEEEEEEDENIPTETFSFSYKVPSIANTTIALELSGFPMESEQIWNSTGLTLWPCSHYLCEYLVQNVSVLQLQNKSSIIVELGSGLGRCGLLVHHLLQQQQQQRYNGNVDKCRTTTRVLLTDGDTDTLKQLRANVLANNNNNTTLSDTTTITTTTQQLSCHQLLWGTESTQQFCQQQCLENNGCDLVIGSDLIYVPQVIEPLFGTIRVLLLQPNNGGGTFLMAHSNRRAGSSVTLEMVLEGATQAGLSHEIVQEVSQEGIYIIMFRLQD